MTKDGTPDRRLLGSWRQTLAIAAFLTVPMFCNLTTHWAFLPSLLVNAAYAFTVFGLVAFAARWLARHDQRHGVNDADA